MSPRNNKSGEIKYNWRFRVPTSEQILKALKTKKYEKDKNDKTFENLIKYFKPLPKPTDNLDWLVQFYELGQDCSKFIKECPLEPNKLGVDCYIYYIQIGDFKQTKLGFEDLIEYSKCFFGKNSIKLLPFKIDLKFFKAKTSNQLKAYYNGQEKKLKFRYNSNTNKIQILVDSFFKLLKKIKPNDSCGLIGFTEYDLYADESDLFVAGLCDGDLRVGMFSCIRYDPRIKYSEQDWFDFRISKKMFDGYYSIFLMRCCKLLAHETCHLLGIDHCIYMDCSMNGSGHLKEDFRQSIFLCPIDLKKLNLITNFDIKQRYENLKVFFEKYKSNSDSNWIKNVLLNIK